MPAYAGIKTAFYYLLKDKVVYVVLGDVEALYILRSLGSDHIMCSLYSCP